MINGGNVLFEHCQILSRKSVARKFVMIHYDNDNNAYCSAVNSQHFEIREHYTVVTCKGD